MTRKEALVHLYQSPNYSIRYQGSGMGNRLVASMQRSALVELKEGCVTLTDWGVVLAKEALVDP